MVYHKAITERVIDMKLRVMNHIEQEFMREHYLRERLADLQLKGEEIFKRYSNFSPAFFSTRF